MGKDGALAYLLVLAKFRQLDFILECHQRQTALSIRGDHSCRSTLVEHPHCKSKYQFRDLKGRGTKNEVIEPKGIFCKIAFIECPDCDELFCLVLSLNEDGTGPLVRTYTLRDEK